jgi:hypothetical protein
MDTRKPERKKRGWTVRYGKERRVCRGEEAA